MKQYKEFYHIVNSDRPGFEDSLAKNMREIKEQGHETEVQYQPVPCKDEIVFCALVFGYVEK